MRYISTRHGSQGTPAPLGFEDIMLAGLARDGGLYLPAEWPQLSTADIAALKGLSYTELAFRIMRPYVDGAFDEATFRRLIAEAYASFETPEVAPLKPLGDSGLHLLELFHGPTLAFKDVALQLLGRMLDQTLTARSQHATIVGATSGDTGSAAIEAVRDRKTIDIFMLFPKGRVSEVQRRQMTTVSAPNVHNIAVQGTFDDCQDLAKACFNDLAFRDRHALTAVNSINFARVMAQIVYYFWAALKLGAPDRPVAFTVPSGNFGNVYAGYAAKQMGLPISHFVVGTNSNDILARFFESGTMTMTEVVPTFSPSMDIQISSNFERLLFDLYDRNGVTLADAMTGFRSTGTLKVGANALAGVRALFDAGRVDEPGTLAAIADCHTRFGETIDPHTAVGYAVAQQHRRDPAIPMVVLATAHPAKFPDAVEKAIGMRPPLPARLGDLMDRAERVDGLRNDIDELKAMIDERRAMATAPRDAKQGAHMSEVKVTTLGNGLRVAVDEMPEVESASLGIWVACGTRHESAELNGMAHMLEHMAFKGTRTRSARAIAEEIENVGGSLNAYTGREITAYHASVLKEDVALGVEMISDILRNSVFDPDELQRERGVILQEIGQALDTPDDLIFDQFQETALPGQPLGRPVLGTAGSVEAIGRDDLFAYLARHYTASNMVLSAAGRVEHDRIIDLAEKHFGSVPRTPANAIAPAPLRYVGGDGRETRVLEQAHLVLGCEGIGYRDPDYFALAIYSTLFGGGMSSRLFQRIREERGLVYGIHCFNTAYADGGLFGIYAGTGEDDLAELVPAVCEEFVGVGDTVHEAELVRARNQIKAGTLMALESSGARCEQAARHLIVHGRSIPYAEIVSRIEAVDQDAVRRVARRLLKGELTLAALGPIDGLEALDRIAARLAA